MMVWLFLAAETWCGDLNTGAVAPPVALGPIVCPKQHKAACDTFTSALSKCLKIVTQTGAQMALNEQALSALYKGATDDVQRMGRASGARQIVVTQVQPSGVALVRVINVEDGQIVAVARAALAGAEKPVAQDYRGVTARLTEGLAKGYLSAPGRAKRVAVLPFSEGGELSRKNGIGTLVSAEIVTSLKRDWGVQVVERSRLAEVMKEVELGQYGAVDAQLAPKIGNLLNADALILGSVNDAGDKIVVNAQLIDTTTALTLNAESAQMQAAGLVSLSSDAIVLRTRSGAVFRSLLIPGWGQMYNRQVIKGGVFLGSALALAGAGATLLALGAVATGQYQRAGAGADFNALISRAETFNIAGVAVLSGLGLFWAVNVIDAYINGTTFDSAVAAGGGAMGRF